jgi:hypothetical protein
MGTRAGSFFKPVREATGHHNQSATLFWHNVHMSDEYPFTLQQADQARSDFYAIESELDIIKAQLARLPTRKELARIALGVIFGAAGLVIAWIEAFWRL